MAIYKNLDVRDIPGEQWKRLEKYDGKRMTVLVSNLGRVKTIAKGNKRERIRKQFFNKKGYLRIMLNQKNLLVHRLIAEAFVENENNKRTVNHRNGIKWDNRAINLEHATHEEQMLHAYANDLREENTPIVIINSNGEYVSEHNSKFDVNDVYGRLMDSNAIEKYDNKVWFKNNKAIILKDYYETLTENEKFIIGTECLEHGLKNMFLVNGQLIDGVTAVAEQVSCDQSNVSRRTKDKAFITINNHSVSRLKNMIGVSV